MSGIVEGSPFFLSAIPVLPTKSEGKMVRGKVLSTLRIDPDDPQVGVCCGKADENLKVKIIQKSTNKKGS